MTQRRGTQSTGSRDTNSPWAVSRLAQSVQWDSQIEHPKPPASGPTFKVEDKQVVCCVSDPLAVVGTDQIIKPKGSATVVVQPMYSPHHHFRLSMQQAKFERLDPSTRTVTLGDT